MRSKDDIIRKPREPWILLVSFAPCKIKTRSHLVIYSCAETNNIRSLEKHINCFKIAFAVPTATIKQERPSGPMCSYACTGGQKG